MRFCLLLLCALLTLDGCKDQTTPASVEGELPPHILSHTSGVISRGADVVVTFDSLYRASPGEEVPTLSLSPAVDGTTALNGQQLVFHPAGYFTSGTEYVATVEVPGQADYAFRFRIPERRLSVEADGYYIPDPDRPQRVEVTGRVATNDGATVEEIRDVLSVTYAGNSLEPVIEPSSPNLFSFTATIDDRGSAPSTTRISLKSGGGFAGAAAETEVTIDRPGNFTVTAAAPAPDGNGIIARFSDPVDAGQDLTGLLRFRPEVPFTTSVDGNLIRIYPVSTEVREAVLVFDPKVSSVDGQSLGSPAEWQLTLGHPEPGLRAVGNGTIMPHEGQRLYTFEAVGLDSVYLEVFRIQSGNVLQFLQDESLSGTSQEWSLRRVGTIVARERIALDALATTSSPQRWTRYAIDLDGYVTQDDAAIYQIRLGFGLEDTDQSCSTSLVELGLNTIARQLSGRNAFVPGFASTASLLTDYSGIYGYGDWETRDDPCSPAYYHRDRFLLQNVLSSNLGLIAKRNPDRSTVVFTTNLLTSGPQGGVAVTAYSYDRRELFSGTTDADGKLSLTTDDEPAFLFATLKQEAAYLRLDAGDVLPLGRFDVGGTETASGLRGAFFAERGVWRPGDSVFLHFVLEDKAAILPEDYPVSFTLQDARGRVVERRNVTPAFEGGLYPLPFATDAGDATGTWTATVEAGGKAYTRSLPIESVKPNRLAIDLLPTNNRTTLALTANWLYGAPAAGLRATVDLLPREREVDFGTFTDFVFQDPARTLTEVSERQVFDGRLDGTGRATVAIPKLGEALPGPLQLRLSTKVFEPGGNFSVDNGSLPFDPYAVYAGVRLPQDEWGSNRISAGSSSPVEVAAVDPAGKGIAGRRLSVGIYRVDWRYWWQDGNDNVARFASNQHQEAIATLEATTDADGRARVPVSVERWGRYLIRVCDAGGHCTGDYFYGGYGEDTESDRESASLLRLRAENSTVNAGERVALTVPTSAGGQLLVSLETSLGSIEQFWVPTTAGETAVSFETDARMVPTVYANLTYLQPYAQTTNDRPVRLFGVVPVEVLEPQSLLRPELTVADQWKPQQTVDVVVREADNRAMTYVLAVVDEGLLGLTRFQTPDLHADFFSKEALAVKTYDLYNHVMSSINGEFGRVLSVGGDGTVVAPEEASANRFPPVVRHLGPFRLAKGETARHEISLPNYFGAVRVMVVALAEGAYGSTEARVPVRQPLMVLPTLPRVLGPGERVDLPVSVFALEPRIKEVRVSVKESAGLVELPRSDTSLTFSTTGDRLTYFSVRVGERTGVARFEVTATGNGEQSSQDIEIDVREPNVPTRRSNTLAIPPNESRTVSYEPFGLPGTRSAYLELSGLPAMNLQRHLDYLMAYPYGCVEQVVAAAFAQVYLDRVMALSPAREASRRRNVAAGIEALRRYRTASGGLSYWPGGQQVHPWATNFALHFLLEAERAGFGVPYDLRRDLLDFQQAAAGSWSRNDGAFYATLRQRTLDQAYRLYTLALAKQSDFGAMNRLRGLSAEMPAAATYQLAAAYALAGRQTTATELIRRTAAEVAPYRELGYTFGSDLRDMAVILDAQLALNDGAAAAAQALRLARAIGGRPWLTTQEAAFAFVAFGNLGVTGAAPVRADFTSPGGKTSAVGVAAGVYSLELPTAGSSTYSIANTGVGTLFVTTHITGTPPAGEEAVVSNQLALQIDYTDLNGKPINVTSLESGSEFVASYRLTNPGTTGQDYRQLALSTLLPSGWEVANSRLSGADSLSSSFEYQDIRDDRINTFFDLPARKSKTYRFRMTATYPGRYYLPTQLCEAMYDPSIRSETKGKWVEVRRSP